MIKFGLGDYTTEFNDWAKHHKQLSVHVKREYIESGEVIVSENEDILKLMEEHPDKITKKHQMVVNRDTHESSSVIDFYLPLDNLDYKERDIEHFSLGASNCSYEYSVRMLFKSDEVELAFDHSVETEGSFSVSFYDIIQDIDSILDDIASDDEIPFEKKGIEYDEDGNFYVVAVNEHKRPMEFEIEKRELLNSLVGVEIYNFKMEIH